MQRHGFALDNLKASDRILRIARSAEVAEVKEILNATSDHNHRRDHAPDLRAALAAALTAAFIVVSAPTSAAAEPGGREPSSQQLDRLEKVEPYIRYFTSLSYGPNDARVSPLYLKALMLTESGGRLDARSSKGARGLTQIMPATAKHVARQLAAEGYDYLYIDEDDLANFAPGMLYDPAMNILIACYISATYHERFAGRTELVAAAWNAGPGAVERYGNQPPPYRETKNLISRVLAYMDFFQAVRLTRVAE